MTKPQPKILIVVPVENAARLAVQLSQAVKATNGQEFITGQVAGFVPESAASMVLAGVGKAFLFDQAAVKPWAAALITAGVDEDDDERIISLMVGPFASHIRQMKAQVDEAQARAVEARKAREAREQTEREENLKLQAEREEREKAEAEVKAKAAAELKAAQEAEEKRIADEDQKLAAEGLARASADVSNPDVTADAMGDKQPAPTPPAPEPTSRRGNRTPRS